MWLMTAGGIVEAQLIRGALEGGSIPVLLDHRDPSPFAWMYPAGNPNAPVQVFVPAALLDTARLALLEAGLSFPDESPGMQSATAGNHGHGALRVVLVAATVIAAAGIVLFTYLGSATCALRLLC